MKDGPVKFITAISTFASKTFTAWQTNTGNGSSPADVMPVLDTRGMARRRTKTLKSLYTRRAELTRESEYLTLLIARNARHEEQGITRMRMEFDSALEWGQRLPFARIADLRQYKSRVDAALGHVHAMIDIEIHGADAESLTHWVPRANAS